MKWLSVLSGTADVEEDARLSGVDLGYIGVLRRQAREL
jgi:hypothetical protein